MIGPRDNGTAFKIRSQEQSPSCSGRTCLGTGFPLSDQLDLSDESDSNLREKDARRAVMGIADHAHKC